MKLSYLLAIFFILSTFTSCIETINNYTQLPNGIWRGSLVLNDGNFTTEEGDEEVFLGTETLDESEIPFNFEISYNDKGVMQATLINGEERITVSDIDYGRNNRVAKDSFRFNFPEYDSYLKGEYEDNAIEGKFVITSKDNYYIPFRATFGKDYRFTALQKQPTADLSGKWECTFEEGTEYEYKALGEFVQDKNELRGTFRTETGDYRFLEGTVQGNKGYLSVFDGTHAFLFAMKIVDENSLVGSFRSGKHYKTTWSAQRNANFELTDPSKLTYITDDKKAFDFSFPDATGRAISLEDPMFQDKARLLTIMGTWCPNCKDEMQFLKTIQNKYKQDVAVLAIAFERYKEQEKAFNSITRYTEKLQLNFPMVHGGKASKTIASETFPQLNKIISFPTMILLDKENNVQYIHTGFNGPATSKYSEFVDEFTEVLEETLTKK